MAQSFFPLLPVVPSVCTAQTISELSDLTEFVTRQCISLSGALVISNLNPAVSQSTLQYAFQNLLAITDGLIIMGNTAIATLDFLSTLQDVPSVKILNNDGLVDARLPNLNRSAMVTVEGNRRLCSLNFPLASGTCST